MENKLKPSNFSSPTINFFDSPPNFSLSSAREETLREHRTSEGFQFSFNEASKDENRVSWEPSPLPTLDRQSQNSKIYSELSNLQSQIKLINSKLHQNLEVLKEKELKQSELKKIIEKHEIKSTMNTDESFIEAKCCWFICSWLR